jgi:signal peptidase I
MHVLRRLRKYVFWFALCLGLAILLKWGVVAGYSIPTPSMEPLLRGDADDGDKVAVFKLHYKLFSPRRHDLVVFFKEGEFTLKSGILERSGGLNFVKRLVGLPGEKILIMNGDLFLGDPPAVDRKSLDVIRSMLIPVYRSRFDERFFDQWRCEPGEGAARLEIREDGLLCDNRGSPGSGAVRLLFAPESKVVQDDYLLEDGTRHRGRVPVRDLALTLVVEFLSGGGELSGRLREVEDRFDFVLRSREGGGGGEVFFFMTGVEPVKIAREDFSGFRPGRTYRICFMNIDDRILLLVDGRVIADIPYEGNSAVANPDPILWNAPSLSVENASVLFHEIRIDRDVHYTTNQGRYAVEKPYEIPQGHYFFLGDNSPDSQDSRSFGGIPEKDLVGRPFMIFHPFRRLRFF